MAYTRQHVLEPMPRSDRLPDWASEGAVLIERLHQDGLLDRIAERLRIVRPGGYVGFDVFIFFLLYFTSSLKIGLKAFAERVMKHRTGLAALAGRASLPSSSAISRALRAVQTQELRPQINWLLVEATGAVDLLGRPSVMTYDCTGQAWSVYDFDYTITTLRQRALPAGEDLPEARRRAAPSFAKPGYKGRKRGDIHFGRAALQHAGSGVWIDLRLSPGSSERRPHFKSAVCAAVTTTRNAGLDHTRVIIRTDTEFGSLPHLVACIEGGAHYVTRCTRYHLLERREVLERLPELPWAEVADSGTGPRRYAADLGEALFYPARETRREDGSTYEPLPTRVVVARFRTDKPGSRGRWIEGWLYELFPTSLPVTPWPAPEVVTTYFGRNGQENRFCQEDRELNLDRIFSYTLAGQEWASLVGLMVWNLRLCAGTELDPLPADIPHQSDRPVSVHHSTPALPIVESDTDEDGLDASPTETPEPLTDSIDPSVNLSIHSLKLTALLNSLDWPRLLSARPGWRWNVSDTAIECDQGSPLPLRGVELRTDEQPLLRFGTSQGLCSDCSTREDCVSSTRPNPRKFVRVPVGQELAEQIRWHLHMTRRFQHELRQSDKAARRSRTRAPQPLVDPPPPRLKLPDEQPCPGPLSMLSPRFLPASARSLFQQRCRLVEVHVRLRRGPMRRRPHRLIACDDSARQHRRNTWQQRFERYALPDRSHVRVLLRGGEAVSSVLHAHPQ